MPTITRSYSIEYGSTVIGGTSDKFLLRKRGFGIFESYRSARVEFEVIVTGDTTSEFKDNNVELLDAFRTIRQRLQVKTPDGLRDYNPSSSVNTGFNAEPEIRVVQGRQNGPKFRNYACSITVELPADLTGQAGRRDNTVAYSHEKNDRRTYTFRGTYTALGSNDATAQFTASISAYETAQLPGGANWQFLTQDIQVDDTDKNLQFTRVHKEITLDQAIGTPNHASVKEQQLKIRRVDTGGQNSYINGNAVKPLSTFSVDYTAIIDINVTPSSGLVALYEGTLKPHILNEISSNLRGTAGSSIDDENVEYDLENNVISSTFTYRALNGTQVIESRLTKQLIDRSGLQHTPVTTGRDHEYAKDKGPPERILRVTVMEKRLGGTFYEYQPPKDFDLLTEDTTGIQEVEGKFPDVLRFKRRTKVYEYKFAKEYKGGGSSGGTVLRRLPSLTNFDGNGL